MTSKKTKRSSSRRRRTAIVPRVVFQTLVAVSVVPAATALAGCGQSTTPQDSGVFAVAVPNDAGRDAGVFAVAVPLDAGRDAGTFSVAAPLDAGPDSEFFSVVAIMPDTGA